MIKKFMTWIYIIAGVLILISIARVVYGFMYPNVNNNSNGGMFNFIFLITGLVAGVAIALFISKKSFLKQDETRVEASVMLNKVERVFKVVTAEGHFSEVFDYSQTSHFASLIPSTKKALLIVNAKVLMGFDFKKLKIEIDEDTKEMHILEFPQPEVLSIEPDIKYYNMEDGLFNKFNSSDLTMLQKEAKEKIVGKIASSDLPSIAQKQMQQLLVELGNMQQWHLIGAEKILLSPPAVNQ